MPFMILYGGELVFLFLGVRIARWMWRSRENVLALWRERHGAPPSGPSFTPDPIAAPAALASVAELRPKRAGARESVRLREAA
jgi:hypothetical protein